jgi:hypothetical protein
LSHAVAVAEQANLEGFLHAFQGPVVQEVEVVMKHLVLVVQVFQDKAILVALEEGQIHLVCMVVEAEELVNQVVII